MSFDTFVELWLTPVRSLNSIQSQAQNSRQNDSIPLVAEDMAAKSEVFAG
jgi:hypothetical protein